MQSLAPLKPLAFKRFVKNHPQTCEKNTERNFIQYVFLPDVVLEKVCHRDKYSCKQCWDLTSAPQGGGWTSVVRHVRMLVEYKYGVFVTS